MKRPRTATIRTDCIYAAALPRMTYMTGRNNALRSGVPSEREFRAVMTVNSGPERCGGVKAMRPDSINVTATGPTHDRYEGR